MTVNQQTWEGIHQTKNLYSHVQHHRWIICVWSSTESPSFHKIFTTAKSNQGIIQGKKKSELTWGKHLRCLVLLLQHPIRQHIYVRLCRVALQHQCHHVVLTRKNLTELLSQAGRFLRAPVCPEPRSRSSKLPLLVSHVPCLSMSSPFAPAPSACCCSQSST